MSERGLLDLTISLLPGLKTLDKISLLGFFNREEELYTQSRRDIEEILKHELKVFWDTNEIRDKAGRIDTICEMRSIKWVSWIEKEYPPLLREIYDPPPVVFFRGNLPDPEKSLLGMVGTRRPSPDATDQAYKIGRGMGQAGVSVVSGLALGIDAMSHRGNLAGGVPGYAVLGSGVDEIYPSANRSLAKKILDSGGALISEYPPGVRPDKWTFPARNRIISALSRSVLIVQAPQKSGALITAALALDQGKELWVASCGVKQGAFDNRGTCRLAQDGADIIYTEKDIFEKWGIEIAANGEEDVPARMDGKGLISSIANFLKIEI
jgi:DNA processing protein